MTVTTASPPKTAQMTDLRVTIPGYVHNLPVRGHPEAGQVFQFRGHPAVSVILGDRIEGTVQSRPGLTADTLGELDELISALIQARVRLAMWLDDHPATR